MKTIGLGIIGAGEIAQNFHLPILSKLHNLKLLAICDRNNSKAQILASKYNISYVKTDYNELLKIDNLEAVVICTTTDSHCEIALAALEAGKHVFIEKPIALNFSEANQIVEKQKNSNLKVMIGMNQRFRFDAIMLKNWINNGELGSVFYVNAGWYQHKRGQKWLDQAKRSGGGVLIDLGLSLIDSLLWFYDFIPVKSVKANLFRNRTKNVEDFCFANLKLENGSIANLESSWSLFSSKNYFFYNLYGNKGSAKINPLQLFKSSGDTYTPSDILQQETNLFMYRRSYKNELKHFLNSICGFCPVISTAEEAAYNMKIVELLYQSAKEDREIYL